MEQCISDNLLIQFLANELEGETSELVEDHLNQCPLCQKKVESYSDDMELKLWHECHQRQLVNQDSQQHPFSEDRLDRLFNSTISSIYQVRPTQSEPAPPVNQNSSLLNNSGTFRRKLEQDTIRVIGNYHLVQKIGQGGMGIVYLAVHAHLKKNVVIKLLLNNDWENSNQTQRFYREMELVGQLDHPNIVKATDAGEMEETCFLVMEYLEGHDLKKILKQERSVSVTAACAIIRQAANGLQYIHNNNLIHRDIKPSNLFLTKEGKVKILDLGLAGLTQSETSINDLTDSNCIMGSAYYMAPEQALHVKTIDQRSDIYSLGCTFYQLLTGQLPFRRNSPVETIMAHREQDPPRLSDHLPEIPERLETLFQSMIKKDPKERIQTMAEVVKQIDDFFNSEQDFLDHEASDTNMTHSQELVLLCQNTDLSPPVEARSAFSSTLLQPQQSFWSANKMMFLLLGVILIGIGLFSFRFPPFNGVVATGKIPVAISPEQAQREREFAIWALEQNCLLNLQLEDGKPVTIDGDLQQLPDVPFKIVLLNFAQPLPLSAKDLEPLQKLSGLKTLLLDDCRLEDDALTAIETLVTLEKLDVHNTGLTDTGLASIGKLKNMKNLSLHKNPHFTDAGLQELNHLHQLEKVDLARTNTSDKGIQFIQSNLGINWLKISETQVSDASIPHLKALKQMGDLYIKKNNMSDKGIQELQEAFPIPGTIRFD